MMGRETTKEVSPFYEYCRKKSEWKESGLEALDLFCPTYLEFGRLVFASLGLKPPPGVCRERYHSLNLSTGCANLARMAKFGIPVLNDLTNPCHAGLPFVGTSMKIILVVPCGVVWKIDEYHYQLHQIGRRHLSGGFNRYRVFACPPHRFSQSLLQSSVKMALH